MTAGPSLWQRKVCAWGGALFMAACGGVTEPPGGIPGPVPTDVPSEAIVVSDLDHDGIADAEDNCPVEPNAAQHDSDGDGVGDACSSDDDGDGIADVTEVTLYGTDPTKIDTDGDGLSDPIEIFSTQTNPLKSDTDGDGYSDSLDLFPLDSDEWEETDGDGIGDQGDNCPDAENPAQENSDLAYAALGVLTPSGGAITIDAKGDACDADRDGDGLHATYVDIVHGDDSHNGSFLQPVRTLATGLALAQKYNDEIRLAAGTYDITDMAWPDNQTIRGGYVAGFSARQVKTTEAQFATVLTSSGSATTMLLSGVHDLRLDGVIIRNGTLANERTALAVSQGSVTLIDTVLHVTGAGFHATALQVSETSAATVDRSLMLVEGDPHLAIGIVVSDSTVRVVNSLVQISGARHARGLSVAGASGELVHNTIRIGTMSASASTAYGIAWSDSPLVLANTLLATENATDQAPLLCSGTTMAGSTAVNNLLAAAGGQGLQPLAIDCTGEYLYADAMASGDLPFSGATLIGTVGTTTPTLATVLQDNGALTGPLGVDQAEMSLSAYYNVSKDYFNQLRQGVFDVGAFEQ
ncbi:MAG: thrombospondin type 3 repeat-containing protein [Deltaproteobacteria bacterium]|nr:thrombospondin type 3 repeat-containing protein [Deltaproteobacteria bacterium]